MRTRVTRRTTQFCPDNRPALSPVRRPKTRLPCHLRRWCILFARSSADQHRKPCSLLSSRAGRPSITRPSIVFSAKSVDMSVIVRYPRLFVKNTTTRRIAMITFHVPTQTEAADSLVFCVPERAVLFAGSRHATVPPQTATRLVDRLAGAGFGFFVGCAPALTHRFARQ